MAESGHNHTIGAADEDPVWQKWHRKLVRDRAGCLGEVKYVSKKGRVGILFECDHFFTVPAERMDEEYEVVE